MKRCTFGSIYVIESNNEVVVCTPHFATTIALKIHRQNQVYTVTTNVAVLSAKMVNVQKTQPQWKFWWKTNQKARKKYIPPDEMLALLAIRQQPSQTKTYKADSAMLRITQSQQQVSVSREVQNPFVMRAVLTKAVPL